jgi:hypothetical protein
MMADEVVFGREHFLALSAEPLLPTFVSFSFMFDPVTFSSKVRFAVSAGELLYWGFVVVVDSCSG